MRGFLFAMGLIAGLFGALAAHNLGWVRLRRTPAAARPAASTTAPEAESPDERPEASVEAVKSDLTRDLKDPQGKNLDALAVLLEEAIFERSWPKVQAAAETVRSHGAEWVAPHVGPPPAPQDERSLFDVATELERRRIDAMLTSGNNRATEIARRKDPRSIELWFEILNDASAPEDARVDAAWLIARSGDERAIGELIRMLSSPDLRVASWIAQVLAREGYSTGLKEIVRLTGSGDPKVRAIMVRALGFNPAVRRGEANEARTLIELARNDVDAQVRREAVGALSHGDIARLAPYMDTIVAALADREAPVRRIAAGVLDDHARLGNSPTGAMIRAFERALRSEENDDVAGVLLHFLATYGDAQSLAAIDDFGATELGRRLGQAVGAARESIRLRSRGR